MKKQTVLGIVIGGLVGASMVNIGQQDAAVHTPATQSNNSHADIDNTATPATSETTADTPPAESSAHRDDTSNGHSTAALVGGAVAGAAVGAAAAHMLANKRPTVATQPINQRRDDKQNTTTSSGGAVSGSRVRQPVFQSHSNTRSSSYSFGRGFGG
ncbi:hypothetical protein NFHSH190041_33130 [Shewanella sp. NFH-SH190041]|uniref:hypothetical protein n=1 Tax=Shewanella sp. NFH-SH190041 TaxID=2950245 RepID=UPI0021C2E6EE|nr:hypothetical protein [Shewanella sp. NFH-SH190041]BDM65861.1 hypothetical protein NFHSH190041_33130 [Shewanella sp. NFH-SH190041]